MTSNRAIRFRHAARAVLVVAAMTLVAGVLALPASGLVRGVDVAVEKTAASATIEAGQTASFTMTVSNLGSRTARDVTLDDVLPDGALAWAENPDVAECTVTDDAGGDILSCFWDTLAPGASVSVTVEAATNPEICDYTLDNTATVAAKRENVAKLGNNTASASIAVTCPPPSGCTLTQGFWKTHYPDAWPASVISGGLTLGTVSYTADELESIFNTPPAGNGLITLAHQLIAAKVNIANGADGTDAAQAITDADALIGGLVVPPVGSDSLSPDATSDLTQALDDFNSGLSGPGHCDDLEELE